MERRLAAIVAADMVGFSSQMQLNETGTLARLKRVQTEFIEPGIAVNRGRIFKTMGDGFLAEFASAIDALNAAVAIQKAIAEDNTSLESGQQCLFRIGINIGDIIVEESGDVFGDGVNIAARLEPFAPSGGIVVSNALREQLWNKVEYQFVSLGIQQLKNIFEGIDVYRVLDKGEVIDPPKPEPDVKISDTAKPLLAILPFDNMSADPDQAYLGDGITEDLITSLSQIGHLSVLSRNSAFTFKDRTVSTRDIRTELGVHFVVTGSLRKSGNRIRITAWLTDTESDVQIWSGRYDRELEDIFAIQDEITLTIATELQVELTEGEQAKLRYTTTDNLAAWSAFTRGVSCFRNVSADNYVQARRFFEDALTADPSSAQIRAMLACTHAIEGRFLWTEDPGKSMQQAKELADSALEIDPDNADAWAALGYRHMGRGELEDSVAAYRRAVSLAPEHADLRALFALALTFAEKPNEAVVEVQCAIDLNPLDPGWYSGVLGHAFRYASRFDEALNILNDYNQRNRGFGLVDIVLTYADMGDVEKSRQYGEMLLSARPQFTISSWALTQNCLNPDRLITDKQSLLDANLPE
jgi:adenylate cyclase